MLYGLFHVIYKDFVSSSGGAGVDPKMPPVTDGDGGLSKLVDDHIKDNAIMVSNRFFFNIEVKVPYLSAY